MAFNLNFSLAVVLLLASICAADEPHTLRVVATGYCPDAQSCGRWASIPDAKRRFADGSRFRRGKGVAAVDTSVIAFGTRMWIPGYGMAVARDRGGKIKGNRIDLLFRTRAEALAWGRRTVTVQIR